MLSAENPLVVKVRCGGALHRVWFDGKHLCFPDHDLTSEKTLAAMGGPPCCCLRVLLAWQRNIRDGVPASLRQAYQEYRRKAKAFTPVSPLGMTWTFRKYVSTRGLRPAMAQDIKDRHDRLLSAVQDALYVQSLKTVWSPHVSVAIGKDRFVSTDVRGGTIKLLAIGPAWAERALKYNLATAADHFVIAILTEGDVEHFHARRLVEPSWGASRWWTCFGENPDLKNNRYVLAIRRMPTTLMAWPARVLYENDRAIGLDWWQLPF